jgi:hypothetical protein
MVEAAVDDFLDPADKLVEIETTGSTYDQLESDFG